ncbi:MAG TPA: hypothetical protein VK815_08900 [Candidatus Acidoferrales bacterium]|jgi:hypothetical protein|nr:hypothetical protein [Candidatus Acidoferrales bacterium]
MTKKNILLIVAAVVLGAVYAVYFTDWFKPKTVQIFHTSRNLRPRALRGGNGALPNLIFGINQQLKLTEIRVVEADVYQTNQSALPLWHLISDSNSVPVKQFHYGQFIGGMKPAVKGARPQSLETNVDYLLIVQAGPVKGEHPFDLK